LNITSYDNPIIGGVFVLPIVEENHVFSQQVSNFIPYQTHNEFLHLFYATVLGGYNVPTPTYHILKRIGSAGDSAG
jgi:hypothetical protein